MEQNWSTAGDLAHFKEIWEYRRPDHERKHTEERWDERARVWAEGMGNGGPQERVKATAEYFRARGLLGGGDDVIDVGCGPGRFVVEFAKTARHVVGTDLSGRMLAYGARYAEELGVENTSYVEADFQKADLDKLGWRNRFDLVFSSITPAIGGAGLQKLMDMSRGWCFNSCVVRSAGGLEDELAQNVLGREPQAKQSGHWQWFYALFNLLLLEGCFPETTYYKEARRTVVQADAATARAYAERLARAYGLEEDVLFHPVARYLERHADGDGLLDRRGDRWYGWILWNVNSKKW